MAYFHPWTLRSQDAEDHVPFAGHLRKSEETWQTALRTWLDGNVLCEEARRFVGNFLSVHRVRTDDGDSEPENSDNIISDEELILSKEALDDALSTRIGGRAPKADAEEAGASSGHSGNSKAAVQKCHDIWARDAASGDQQPPAFVAPEAVDEALASARASQKQEAGFATNVRHAEHAAALRIKEAPTPAKVRAWLDELPSRKTQKDGPLQMRGSSKP